MDLNVMIAMFFGNVIKLFTLCSSLRRNGEEVHRVFERTRRWTPDDYELERQMKNWNSRESFRHVLDWKQVNASSHD